jgi:hypothetical protein
MTTQIILNALRATHAAVNADGSFIYGRRDEASLFSIAENYPIINCRNEIRITKSKSNKTFSSRVVLYFYAQDDPASNPDTEMVDDPAIANREDLKNAMEILCDAFMTSFIYNYDTVFGEPDYDLVFEEQKLAGIATGVGCTFLLTGKLKC